MMKTVVNQMSNMISAESLIWTAVPHVQYN